MKEKILLFLFEHGFYIKFNIVGEISISELYLIFTFPFWIRKIKWGECKELKTITTMYVVLFLAQLTSEFFVSNGLASSMKAIALTVASYLHFIFLFLLLSKDLSLLVVLIIFQILAAIVLGSSFEGVSPDEVLAGEEAVYLKFYLAPLILNILILISLLYPRKTVAQLFVFVGLSIVVLGARSMGGIIAVCGIIAYLMEHKFLVRNKSLLVASSVIVLVVGYFFYVTYVNKVLAGEITSGNSKQIFRCNNPYNPIELLMAGRSEAWVGWQAFMDKPLFGHGAWALDETGKYTIMAYELHDEEFKGFKPGVRYLIPGHSVVITAGLWNGAIAFIMMSAICLFFFIRGVRTLPKCDRRYILYLSASVIQLFWVALFSPQSHFRLSMPLYFASIFAIYLTYSKPQIQEQHTQ